MTKKTKRPLPAGSGAEDPIRDRNLLRTILETIPDKLYFKDAGSRFVRNSRAHAKSFGVDDPADLVGKTDFDFFSEEHAGQAFEDEQRIIRTGEPLIGIEEKETWPDGRVTWVSTTKMPLRDEKGEIVGTFGISRDITAQKEAELALSRERNLLHALLDTIPDHIYFKDAESRFVRNSRAHVKSFGVDDPADLVGKTDFDFFSDEHAGQAFEDEQRIIRTGEPLIGIEEKETWPDGRVTWASSTKMPLKDEKGEVVGTFGISRDITRQKEIELEAKNLTAALKRSNQELEEFASVASHDLQEPLRMISGYLNLIVRRYQDRLDQDGREFIAFAVDGAQRMQVMIDDLLSYSRVTTQGKAFSLIETEAVLGRALLNLKVAVDEAGARVIHEAMPAVMGDERQIERLFQNLIGNGLKYRRPGDVPDIHVSAQKKDSEWVFGIKDNGIGIDPKYFDRIFGIFQRLHTREQYSGTGIGLAICKKTVERHGGRIWVESEEGTGATFYFTLPAGLEPSKRPAP
ncbi:MAG: PAS domain-containing protein [Candidatus Aminicenantes bacterium]|nr:PAS domain-containing protein [Candidatus Aminicenantes bacterium]